MLKHVARRWPRCLRALRRTLLAGAGAEAKANDFKIELARRPSFARCVRPPPARRNHSSDKRVA